MKNCENKRNIFYSFKYVLIFQLAVLLVSCIGLGQRPKELLSVHNLEPATVQSTIYEYLSNLGYSILEYDRSNGLIVALSEDYDGMRRGILTWRERLTLEIDVRRGFSDPNETIVYGRINREEKPPTLSQDWRLIQSLDNSTKAKITMMVQEISQILTEKGAQINE